MVNTWQVHEQPTLTLLVQEVLTEVFYCNNRQLTVAIVTCTGASQESSWHQAVLCHLLLLLTPTLTVAHTYCTRACPGCVATRVTLCPSTSVVSAVVTAAVTVELVSIGSRSFLLVLIRCTSNSHGWVVAASFSPTLDILLLIDVFRTNALNIVRCDEGEQLNSSLTLITSWTQGAGRSWACKGFHTATVSTSVVIDDTVAVIVHTVTFFLCGLVNDVLEGVGQ